MDLAAYAVEAKVEATHWWFVGRRILFAREISKLGLIPDAKVLDVGTSTGTNLRMLSELGYAQVKGLDNSRDAIQFCQSKGLGQVDQGDICAMPYESESFDLVLATDVIEHVDDDKQAVCEIARILKPGGLALFTVPTFKMLWGLQDEKAHHKRRYRKYEVLNLARRAGLTPQRHYYFNYILFVPIWFARQVIRLFKFNPDSESDVNTPLINSILTAIFRFDVYTAPLLRVPFGVSALVLVHKEM